MPDFCEGCGRIMPAFSIASVPRDLGTYLDRLDMDLRAVAMSDATLSTRLSGLSDTVRDSVSELGDLKVLVTSFKRLVELIEEDRELRDTKPTRAVGFRL
jgi:hypothetical protein